MNISTIPTKVVFVFIALLAVLANADPMGTIFTYQGRLIDANQPAQGLYDLNFCLYDSPTGVYPLGDSINVADFQIEDGYFTVELDFGHVFDGNNRWLEIGIRPGQENDPYPYTILSPRQSIRPSPYAISTRGLYVDPNENVGIKTSHPHTALQVNGTIFGLGQTGCTNGDCPVPPPYTGVYGESVTGDGILGVSPYGYAGHFIGNVNTEGNMYISGNTGIGTTSPGEKLDVDSGNILIRGQQNFAAPGNQAILYLGDMNHSIRSQYAYGLIVDLWAAPNALVVRESTGNVGIGIDPTHKFDVAGPANLNSGISGGTTALYVNNSEAIWYNGTYFSWGYGGTNNYFADGITINTTSPQVSYELTVSDDIYAYGTVSALTLVDRTPYPKDLQTAYNAVMSMERLPDGQYDQNNKERQIDHSRLSHFIRSEDGGRDLSATVSCLNEVVKDLIRRTEELEKARATIQHLQQQVLELQTQNTRLEIIEQQLKQLSQMR